MKKISFIGVFILSSVFIDAQAPNWLWAKSAGGNGSEGGFGISSDAAGNVFVTGYFQSASISFGTTTLTNAGTGADYNMFIVKYGSSGNVLWAKSAGGVGNDEGDAVATDAAGNVYVTGYFLSQSITFGTITLTNAATTELDVFLVKYDASGNVLWAKSFGAAGQEAGWGVSTDATGNVYLTGFFGSSSITFGTTTLTSVAFDDIFIAKLDAAGNVLWARSAGSTGNDFGVDISTDAAGNAYVTGRFEGHTITFGNITLTNAGGEELFIAKYSPAGNVLWAKSAGGLYPDVANGISVDAAGNAFVTGYFVSSTITFGNITLTHSGPTTLADVYIAKYDPSGNVLWAKSGSGEDTDVGYRVSTDAAGNVYWEGLFVSSTITFGSTTLTNVGGADIFLVKYDASGNLLWAKATGSVANDIGYGMSTDPAGNLLLTGLFVSPSITFGTTTLTNSGNGDLFVAKLPSTITAVAEPNAEVGIVVDPNPVGNQLTISSQQVAIKNVAIYDVLGRQVFRRETQSAVAVGGMRQITIELSQLKPGSYFLRIETANRLISRQFIHF